MATKNTFAIIIRLIPGILRRFSICLNICSNCCLNQYLIICIPPQAMALLLFTYVNGFVYSISFLFWLLERCYHTSMAPSYDFSFALT